MTVKFSNKRLKNWPELKLLILWKINTSCKSDTTRLQEQFANQSLVIIFNIESWFHSNIFRQFWKSYILHIVIFRLEFRAFCCFRGTKDTNTKSLSPKGLKIFCFAFEMHSLWCVPNCNCCCIPSRLTGRRNTKYWNSYRGFYVLTMGLYSAKDHIFTYHFEPKKKTILACSYLEIMWQQKRYKVLDRNSKRRRYKGHIDIVIFL